MIGADFTLKVRVSEEADKTPSGYQRVRRINIHIEPLEENNPEGTLNYAYRIANRIALTFQTMPTACEVTITGKGVPA